MRVRPEIGSYVLITGGDECGQYAEVVEMNPASEHWALFACKPESGGICTIGKTCDWWEVASVIKYKGFVGTIEPDLVDNTWFGRIIKSFEDPLPGLMYEGETISRLRFNMQRVIDDWLILRKKIGRRFIHD